MTALLIHLFRAARLAHAIHAAHPDVPADRAWPAAVAIVSEARGYEPELLAAIAWAESRFGLAAVNARTGVCGPGQTRSTRAVCRRIAAGDARLGYREMVRVLDGARAFCARRGDRSMLCALAGYASGPAGVRGRWYRGPRAVLRRAERLRALSLGQRPGPVTRRSAS